MSGPDSLWGEPGRTIVENGLSSNTAGLA